MRVLDIIAYIEDDRSLQRGPDMAIDLTPVTIDLIPTPVPVSAHHIAHGRRHRCYACPLALAVDDLLIDGYFAHVSPPELAINTTHFDLGKQPVEIVITLPADAIKFVEDYDDEREVSPRDYLIPLPRHMLRAAGDGAAAHSPASP